MSDTPQPQPRRRQYPPKRYSVQAVFGETPAQRAAIESIAAEYGFPFLADLYRRAVELGLPLLRDELAKEKGQRSP